MKTRRRSPSISEIDSALTELKRIIVQKYPQARFEVHRGIDDPDSFELDAIIDVDNGFDVLDLVIDRVMAYQLDDGLPIHVIPRRPSTGTSARAARAAAAAKR